MRIVVAPDKFKSTLSASAVARAMVQGVARADSSITCDECPVADGGEGSAEVMLQQLGGSRHKVTVSGPDGRVTDAWFGELPDGRAVIEMAVASGLDLMEHPNALRASSLGTGELIAAAAESSREVIVFVGGSASTDAGTGAARAIGWRFLDAAGEELALGGESLRRVADVVRGRSLDTTVVAACDVPNPLVGRHGTARVFAPQKGASRRDVEILEAALANLVVVMRDELGLEVGEMRYGGAGGGMGAGLAAFFGATLTSGFDLIASSVGLEHLLDGADLVITGEGRLDETSFEGKVVGGILSRAVRSNTRCVAVVGSTSVSPDFATQRGLKRVIALSDGGPPPADPFDAVVDATRSIVALELAGM